MWAGFWCPVLEKKGQDLGKNKAAAGVTWGCPQPPNVHKPGAPKLTKPQNSYTRGPNLTEPQIS